MAYADNFSIEGHFADALDDLEQFVKGGGTDVLQEYKVRDKQVVGQDQIVDGHGMRSFRGGALSDIELHALVPDAFELPIDRAF
jgi:hypothetical protein